MKILHVNFFCKQYKITIRYNLTINSRILEFRDVIPRRKVEKYTWTFPRGVVQATVGQNTSRRINGNTSHNLYFRKSQLKKNNHLKILFMFIHVHSLILFIIIKIHIYICQFLLLYPENNFFFFSSF